MASFYYLKISETKGRSHKNLEWPSSKENSCDASSELKVDSVKTLRTKGLRNRSEKKGEAGNRETVEEVTEIYHWHPHKGPVVT